MASFPNAKKTFSQVVNGVTKLVAALFNSPYDEIEAIETFLGATGGGAQSYYTSLTDMLINYRRGCTVEYKGNADLYVRLGEIMIVDASGNRRLRRNTADLTVTWSNIDTGAEENSTQYYVYACADNNATTFTVKISKSATAPAGMTFYRRIGQFYNNASGDIEASSFVNDNANDITKILDYGTSGTAGTAKTQATLKICYGVRTVPGGGSATVTNLPFTSATSYTVTATFGTSNSPSESLVVVRNSASQITITSTDNLEQTVHWIAIGT